LQSPISAESDSPSSEYSDSEMASIWADNKTPPIYRIKAGIACQTSMYQDYLNLQSFLKENKLQPEIIFQQDGAPPHWSTIVCDALDKHFPGRWIGRSGPISWPPRSPDITPLDFFLWGYVKDTIYKFQARDIDQLKTRVKDAITTVDVSMLARTWQEIEYCLDILRATNGAHVQLY
ncbi:hypothetical protein B7P43_G12963, partial [Cryptotermes secundus]